MKALALFWLLAGVAWAGPTADLVGIVHSNKPSSGSMHGYEYVNDAEVFLEGTDYKTKTDGVGLFEFRKIKPGKYVVVVRCEGFQEGREEVELEPFPLPAQVNITLIPLR